MRSAGEDIPRAARITSLADAFDAMTSDRPYRSARPLHEALEEIRRERGHQFDPEVVDAFLEREPKGYWTEGLAPRLPVESPPGRESRAAIPDAVARSTDAT